MEKNPARKKQESNRREMLNKMALLGGLVAGGLGLRHLETKDQTELSGSGETHETYDRPLAETFPLRDLAGRKNGGLAERYLGYEGKHFPEELTINFVENLVNMWKAKIERLPESMSDGEAQRLADFGNARAEEYLAHWKRGPEAIGVPELPEGITSHQHFTHIVNEFSKVEQELIERLDWSALVEAYGLGDRNAKWYVDMLGGLSARAHGRTLMAYSMTEIMPFGGADAAENIPLYDFLARNAGTAFITRIPSIFDPVLSFGPFQFTPYAIEGAIAKRGSRLAMNQFLPEHLRIPMHLSSFADQPEEKQMRDHAAAGFLFGVQNVAIATKSLMDRGNQAAMQAVGAMDDGTFASMLAMHHHRPAPAHEALIGWAEGIASGNARSYESYAPEEVASYGRRSKANFEAIQGYFESQSKS